MNVEQQIRELKTRLDLLENRDLDMRGRRVTNGGRALAASDLVTLGQARELVSSPEVQRIIEQQITTVAGGPFGTPVSLGDTNSQGSSGLYADAQHVHASLLSSKGDLLAYATTSGRLAVSGTNGIALISDSAQTFGLKYDSPWKGAKVKVVTDAVVTGLFEVALPTTAMCGGAVHYSARATDGTDMQVQSGLITYAAVNKAGVYTIDIDKIGVSDALSAGTFSVAFSMTSGADKVTFNVNADTSLSPTQGYPEIRFFLDECSPQTVTFL